MASTTRQSRKASLAFIVDGESRNDINASLRTQYLAIEQHALTAGATGDTDAVEAARVDLDRIGEQFIRYNMGLAGVLVAKYMGDSTDEPEAYMLACMEAMWLAFTTWDPDRSTFGTWSRKGIEGALWREVHFHKKPHRRYHEELAHRAAVQHATILEEVLGRPPSDIEVAQAVGVSVERLYDLRRDRPMSLDMPYGDSGGTLGDIVEGGDGDMLEAYDGDIDWDSETSDGSIVGLGILRGLADEYSEDAAWIRALGSATADLDDLSLYLVLVRTGLHGWNSENLPEIAAATGIGREIVRRKTHKALEAVEQAGKHLPALL